MRSVSVQTLQDFTIPESVEKLNIGGYAFSHCTKLAEFTIPGSVQELTIGDAAFDGSINLINFTYFAIPDSAIGENAFGRW